MKKLLLALLLWSGVARAGGAAAGAVPSAAFDGVPGSALLAVAVRPAALEMVRAYMNQSSEMREDLSVFFVKRLGVDFTRTDGLAFWSTQLGKQARFAFLVRLSQQPGEFKGPRSGSFEGVDLVQVAKGVTAAVVPGGVLFGDEAEVRVGIQVAHHSVPPLGPQSPLGALLTQSNGADLIGGVAVSAMPDPQVQQAAQQYGLQLVTFAFRGDGKIVLEGSGDGAKLQNALGMIDAVMKLGLGQLKMQHDQALAADSGDVMQQMTQVIAYDSTAAFWKEFAPRMEAGKMVFRYQMPQLKTSGMVVPMMGIAAAVAIPSFMKYVKRSKSVEATTNVRQLAEGAARYAEANAAKKKGAFSFPRSTGWTPSVPCCKQPDSKCQPDAKAWQSESFRALEFSVSDPSYFQYRITSDGRGNKARITVEARGDLECNQVESSYKRTVTLDAHGTPQLGPLQGDSD
jgi:type II secretory pathway pseudopilin PulG